MSRISLLIAVYNAETTLRRCLDSLLRQTHTDWQAVCIDDCSADGSLAILREYAGRDRRFTVLHLSENGGQAHARNMGLTKVAGSIVMFLDSDDWLADDALATLSQTFDEHPETDAVLLRVVNVNGGQEEEYPMKPFDRLAGQEAFRLSLDWTIHGIYAARRSVYDRYPYDETCRAYSDDLTTHLHYYISREVRQCAGTYYYWQNPQSVTHRPSVRRFDLLRAKERMRQYLLELKAGQEIIDGYEVQRWLALVDGCMFYHVHGRELSPADRREGLAVLRHAWQTIDRRALPAWLTRKPGYRPMSSWPLFRLQEWVYFSLRGLLGRNR